MTRSTAVIFIALGVASCATTPGIIDGDLKVGFDQLSSFPYVDAGSKVSAAAAEARIPAAIKKLDRKKVVVTGYMLPMKMDNNNLTKEFMLTKGQPDEMMSKIIVNEWIIVEMPKGVKPIMDVPTSFRGTLHVGAMFENGYLTGIYSLEGEEMIGDAR